jgi:myo-inositol 2-dehydrogenase / D-chiro-inositol 1-dehydrogenase
MQRNVEAKSRREFLKHTGRVAAASALAGMMLPKVHAAGSDTIRIALVGCGSRGNGAAVNALSTKANVKLVAMADAFQDSLENGLAAIKKIFPDRVDVPKERQFVGLDAYQKAIDSDVDMVLLCTPPGFRPAQFEAAVKAGKNIFMEKPVAIDAPGVRRIRAANELARQKNLAVAVGHHLRHEVKHREIMKRVHDGAIGDLKFLRVYYNTGAIWVRPRQPDQTEMQYQVRNWYHFTWLSGDHIVEQHVHDIDAGNWFAQGHPIEAEGSGGRQVCVGKDVGEIFDHHAVEYTYANGLKMFSYCRQISGCWDAFLECAHGTKGKAEIEGHGRSVLSIDGQKPMRWNRGPDGHQIEMDELFAALMAGQPYNEADWATDSTMTAILGRMATYSGKIVKWDEASNSQLDLGPKTLAWNAEPQAKPRPDGTYACALPGVTQAW